MSTYNIQPINLRDASEREYAALSKAYNLIRAENLPEDPPIPMQDHITNWHNMETMIDIYTYAAWNPEQTEIIANGDIVIRHAEDNQHLAQFSIDVLPEYRRQGLGRQLLAILIDIAVREKRFLLIAETNDRVPAGEIFMNCMGAEKAMEGHTNQLNLSEVDRGLLLQWQERARQSASEFELGFWNGPYPEEQIAAICELYKVMNQQPHGSLEVEDMQYTPEILRDHEKSLLANGSERWTFYACERATGAFAGFTDVIWKPNRPQILFQANTGVWPQYRNKGLGRWLKAAMLEKVLQDRPQVKYIRTQNEDTNASMLKINTELGFKPYMSRALWQVEAQRVLEYISKNNGH
jgi:mycothiol synthase